MKPLKWIDVLTFLDLCGVRDTFHHYEDSGQRTGQAFFNALPPEYQSMIRGRYHDPFYSDSSDSCILALETIMKEI